MLYTVASAYSLIGKAGLIPLVTPHCTTVDGNLPFDSILSGERVSASPLPCYARWPCFTTWLASWIPSHCTRRYYGSPHPALYCSVATQSGLALCSCQHLIRKFLSLSGFRYLAIQLPFIL
nr:MAG TPA: hypothetical protein [Caudoviricetes sp.]